MPRRAGSIEDLSWLQIVAAEYENRAQQLWEYGRRLGLDLRTAEDVSQDAFVRLLKVPTSKRPDRLDAWLFRVVHNLAIDHHRRSSRVVWAAELEESKADISERVALWLLVDQLPLRQRSAVYLRFRAHLDFATIADILGVSESGARANAHRAMASLRRLMEERQ